MRKSASVEKHRPNREFDARLIEVSTDLGPLALIDSREAVRRAKAGMTVEERRRFQAWLNESDDCFRTMNNATFRGW
jgi:hypothetical protein